MFDQFRLKDVLVAYKQNFVAKQWGDEKYKWEAVKWFQDNWDVNAPDFAEMLNRSLDKTFNLLASNNNFPKGMIVGFAKSAPEEVRAMFIALFDESKDVFERLDAFKMQSSILLEKYGNGAAQHYQYENAISTYLWLRYPDKYYIYKFGEVKTVASELESDYRFKKGAYADNIRNFLKLYDEISAALKEDTELVNLFQSQLTDTCYPDPELKTLTIDVGFYISRYYSQKDSAPDTTSWYGADFDPGLSVEDWSKLLKDETVFTTGALEIMKRMKDYGGMASCTQLAVKYGETKNFYNSGSVALARRVCEATGVNPNTRDDGSTQWWTILYTGRDADKDEDGSFIWKLRDELSAALDKADLSGIELYVAAAPGEQDRGYWCLNANPKIWSFADIAVGEVQSYTLYNENGNKRRIFQNFLDAKAGDMIIGYESNPVKQIVAIGRVSAEQDGEKLFFEKVEGLTSPIDYILQAQNATSIESRNQFLEKASDRMTTALNSVYAEMRTASLHLAKNTKWSLFHKQSSIDTLLSNLSDDLQLATKFSGVQMQVFEALSRREDSKLVLDRYQTVMHDFITQEIGGRGMSAIELMHDNYHYSKENTDCWYTFSKELEPALESTRLAIENKDVYIVSVEDVNDEQE